MDKEYFNALSESFKVYLQKGYFFLDWYRKKGKAYHFVFKKNLKVTNIQLAELVSLIKRFSTQKDQLNFLSVKQLNISIAEIVSSFKDILPRPGSCP